MTSNLRLMILKSLDQKPMSGYGLVNAIEKNTGWKPSYGSMYPQLESMLDEGLLDVKKEGRKKVYSLTESGEKKVASWDEKKTEIYEWMQENIKIMCAITGEDAQLMTEVLERMKTDDDPMGELNPEMLHFKKALSEMYLEGKIKSNANPIKKMLAEMTQKLEELS